MRQVLMVSPHFPPDTSAATHRVRLLAPHLAKYGWEPTILTVEPDAYEGRIEPGLLEMVSAPLRVIRCPAWSATWTRRVGFGDLGLRSLWGLYRACSTLLRREQFEALFITIFPAYPALLGPLLKKRFGVPFVLDYQDPWVGAWGQSVGGGPGGSANLRSRLTREIALRLEPWVVKRADAITAVSAGTYSAVRGRCPSIESKPTAEIPLGAEPADFEYLAQHPRPNPFFDAADGLFHICYVGTLLPMGFETLRAVLAAFRLLRDRAPQLYSHTRLHFFGTSNQTSPHVPKRVLPVAQELGVEACVTEVAPRIDYLDALTVQCQASAILLLGSSESHYTASKLYPALLAGRPILAVFHRASSVVEILQSATSMNKARVVEYDDVERAESRVVEIYEKLAAMVAWPCQTRRDSKALETPTSVFAESLAGRLADVFDTVSRGVPTAESQEMIVS